jgi:putative tryptophan/tyrosine transport system substrate-binding protein
MRRREFIAGLGGAASSIIWPLAAWAQQRQMQSIGYIRIGESEKADPDLTPFRQGLREMGFIEGQNVVVEYRLTEDYDRMPALATDLVRRQVSVIFAGSTPAALAAKTATSTIPIVFGIGDDPVKFGLVASISRPGGNATGINLVAIDLEGKRTEMLRELTPTADTIAALVNPKNPNAEKQLIDLQAAAGRFDRKLRVMKAANEGDIDMAFTALALTHIGALTVAGDGFFYSRRNQIVTLAAQHAIPTIYQRREFADAGGLISYGTDFKEMGRQSGIYVGRILKGEKPADLPVMQPTKFELVINRKTAKALGLTIPETLLATADQVIE